jgi:hypothetical protein
MRRCLPLAVLAVVTAAAAGCEIGDTAPPPVDGSGGGGGLSIEWSSRPTVIPSEPSSNITIERAVFRQGDLRIVGEAGSFDLERDKLEWARGIVPTALPVAAALPGLYARLLFELDGEDDGEEVEYAYEITGTVKVSDTFRPFTIRDTSDAALMLEFSITLPAGAGATIPVRIEIDKIAEAVDFQTVQMEDGRYLVEKSSPQISAVRAAVRAAFGVHGPS